MQRVRKLIDPALQWSGCLSPETHNMKMIGLFLLALAAAMPKNSFAQFTPPQSFMAPPKTPQYSIDYNPQYEMRKMEAQQRSVQDQQRRDMEFRWHKEVWIPPYTNDADAVQGIEALRTDFTAGMVIGKEYPEGSLPEDPNAYYKCRLVAFRSNVFGGEFFDEARRLWWGSNGFFWVLSSGERLPNMHGNTVFFEMFDGGPSFGSVSRTGLEWLVKKNVVTPAEAVEYLLKLLVKYADDTDVPLQIDINKYRSVNIRILYRALADIHPYLKDETWLEKSQSIILTQLPGQSAEIPIKQGDRLADIVTTILSTMKPETL